MERALRNEILELLIPLPGLRTESERQATVFAAGVEYALRQTDLSGSPMKAVTTIVQALEYYGALDGTPALVRFLRYVATTVGQEKQQALEEIRTRLLEGGLAQNTYTIQDLTVYADSRPMEPEQESVSADIGPNPYKGLEAFRETDADRFFGRERMIEVLWERLCAQHERPRDGSTPLRLLAILGPSGSGKSSVARAGLLPKLAEHPLSGTQETRVAVFTPGPHPLEALAVMLSRIDPNPQMLVAKTAALLTVLKQETDGQREGLRRIADTLPDIAAQPLVLLIDQFEEVYSKDVEPDERRIFLGNLLRAAADPSRHVSVILTLRSDFLGQTQQHPDVNQAIGRNGEIVTVMSDTELRDAIAKPAECAGHALDETCVDLLIEQTHDREGALPLLQFALTRIWDGLAQGTSPADTLRQIGGVGGALAGEAQQRYDQLTDTEKAIARRAFLALVQLGEGTRDTRRRISLRDVVAYGEDPADVQTVMRWFADPRARLVTLSAATDGTETAEVTHEALLDHWETLREWLDANREDVRFHRHLAADADYWERQGKPDGKLWRSPDLDLLRQYHQRARQDMTPVQVEFFEASVRKERYAQRVRCVTVTAITMLAVLMSVAAGFAWWMYRDARHQSRSSLIRSVVAYAYTEDALNNRERAALLARQASMLNQRFDGDVDAQIEDALQTVFRIAAIDEGPGYGATGVELLEMVCQHVDIKKALTMDEWEEFVDTNIGYEAACPGVPDVLHLRREPIKTTDMEALSLNLHQDGSVGYPIVYIENDFDVQGEVVVDHATGLMWQQSGSPNNIKYNDVQKYIAQLNREKLGGYDDWRLPTIEELLSLLESEKQSNGLHIDPIFDEPEEYSWYWSCDSIRIKGESSSESAWHVSFNSGYVYWNYFFFDGSYVRAVRSWQ